MEEIKERVSRYWSQRAQDFEEQRLREFESEKKERWLREIKPFLPREEGLRILDIGTGTGFFACLLAVEGHEVTGIDLSPEMIDRAKDMAKRLGIRAVFQVMDAEEPDFDPESYDVVVTRNLTWTLPHLEKAYWEWHRLLKPGGVLLNFDADYYAALAQDKVPALPGEHAHMKLSASVMRENDRITREIGSAQESSRPGWDLKLLAEAGFEIITADRGVHRRIYAEIDEFYNPAPVFMIAARK